MKFSAVTLFVAACANTVVADVDVFMECIETSTSSGCGTSTCTIPAHFYHIHGMPKNGDCISDAKTGTCGSTLSGNARGDNFDAGFLCDGKNKKRFHVELNTGGMIIEDVGTTRCHAALTAQHQSGMGICR